MSNIILSVISILILLLTLIVYKKLYEVSRETLSFTKRQTLFNSYFDNYKLLLELSRMKTDVIYEEEKDNPGVKSFSELTFLNIDRNYRTILITYPSLYSDFTTDIYKRMFKRFNYKLQSFIDIIFNEIERIENDNDLSTIQKTSLINLYKNFVICDYLNLCLELIKNKETGDRIKKSDPLGRTMKDYFSCNTDKETLFDFDNFLKLFYIINKGWNSTNEITNK